MRFVCALVLALVASAASAQTPFPVRFVDVGQTAVVPAGDYVISRETVVRGGTLILEAGVRIQVQSIGRPIQVAGGVLEIRGTETSPVVVEPAQGHNCGQMVTYFAYGQRPRLSITGLDWSTTKNSNAFSLSQTDLVMSSSTIYSGDPASTRRGCVQLAVGSTGVITGCLLECLRTTTMHGSGVIVGNGTSQDDKVQLIDVVTVNCSNPLNVQKVVAVVNGTVE